MAVQRIEYVKKPALHPKDGRPTEEADMEARYTIRNAADLPSPSLVFYEDLIRGNIQLAVEIAGGPERLRPHVKTHKTAEIVSMAIDAGIRKFKCATVSEAEMLAKTAAEDILLAYPLYGRNAQRFAELAARYPAARFSTLIDAEEGLENLAAIVKHMGVRIGIFLDVDVGQHRTGIEPGKEAERLYSLAATYGNLYPAGLHCYDGHNHQESVAERRAAVRGCHATMNSLRAPLLAAGIPVPEVVMGGTPTFPYHAEIPGVTLSPGTFFLQDYSYSQSFPDMGFTPAALIVTRVVSVNRARMEFCIDLGYKGLSSDPKGLRGKLLTISDCDPVFQNEEHWVFRKNGGELPRLGDIVYVLPTHICPTVALHERAYVVDSGGDWKKQWRIIARDRVVGI
jgi:D-serine deaminase-like pyridoxal phosphate-dependent protein